MKRKLFYTLCAFSLLYSCTESMVQESEKIHFDDANQLARYDKDDIHYKEVIEGISKELDNDVRALFETMMEFPEIYCVTLKAKNESKKISYVIQSNNIENEGDYDPRYNSIVVKTILAFPEEYMHFLQDVVIFFPPMEAFIPDGQLNIEFEVKLFQDLLQWKYFSTCENLGAGKNHSVKYISFLTYILAHWGEEINYDDGIDGITYRKFVEDWSAANPQYSGTANGLGPLLLQYAGENWIKVL